MRKIDPEMNGSQLLMKKTKSGYILRLSKIVTNFQYFEHYARNKNYLIKQRVSLE